MNLSVRQATLFVLLLSVNCLVAQGQSDAPNNLPSGSIGGRVTLKGSSASNITVTLQATNNDSAEAPARKATTDEKGNYQFQNVPAGAYQVSPISPAFVINEPPSVSAM